MKIKHYSIIIALLVLATSCKKETATLPTSNSIYGLWVGHYMIPISSPVNGGASFYFSLSVYPDGSLGYKGTNEAYGDLKFVTFASGTWTLSGDTFSFKLRTINYYTGLQQEENGIATYDSVHTELENGAFSQNDIVTATWIMNKVI